MPNWHRCVDASKTQDSYSCYVDRICNKGHPYLFGRNAVIRHWHYIMEPELLTSKHEKRHDIQFYLTDELFFHHGAKSVTHLYWNYSEYDAYAQDRCDVSMTLNFVSMFISLTGRVHFWSTQMPKVIIFVPLLMHYRNSNPQLKGSQLGQYLFSQGAPALAMAA